MNKTTTTFCWVLGLWAQVLSFPLLADHAEGDFPWVTLMCKYADIPDEPKSVEFVQDLFGDQPGQINHYWREASYGKSSLNGSQVMGWYTLPYSRDVYFLSGEPGELVAADCARAADNDVDFSAFYGFNVFTNGPWSSGGSGGTGGTIALTLDGKPSHAITAIGVDGWDDHGLVVHEMAHGFGLLHSNNSDGDDDTYDNPWSIMSSVHGHAVPHPLYGSLAKHFNAYEKDSLGWFDDNEVLELDLDTLTIGSAQRILLTALGRPTTASGTYRMLKLKRGTGGEEDFFFTLEAREQRGNYEANLPGSGVIIHEVDLQTRRAAWVVDSDNPPADFSSNAGVIWTVGEIYEGDGFNVEVTRRLGTGFEVTVTATNGSVGGNAVPFIRPIAGNQQVAVNDPFLLYLYPVDPDGFAPLLVSNTLPQGSTLTDNGDGAWIFRWTPTIDDVGTVRVTFEAIDPINNVLRASQTLNLQVIDGSITDSGSEVSTIPGQPEKLFGNVPWVTLLCKFQDFEAEPASPGFVREMFGDGEGQINDWWKKASYNQTNIDGSLVLGWYELPGPRSNYVSGDNSSDDIDDEKLTRDCIAAADADVDYSRFYGVNTFYNSAFNSHGIGYGKARTVNHDNAGTMATTTVSAPTWTSHTAVVHEMSRAVGLPRANNSDLDDNTYDNPWTNMSDGQGYAVPDLRYGFLAKHINAFEKYSLGWLDPSVVTELRVDTRIPGGLYTGLTPLGSTTTQPMNRAIILRDPLRGPNVYYILEARERAGPYDGALPGSAVIIHEIDLQRSEPAWIVHDKTDGSNPLTYSADPNVMWTVGEVFEIPGASVTIRSRTDRGFTLFIQTGLVREPGNTTIGTNGSPLDPPVIVDENAPVVDTSAHIIGDQPWVTLMCKFADEPEESETPEFVMEMFGDEPGQLNHYWREQSNGLMTLDGSMVLGWYELPGARADYISATEVSDSLVDDCIAMANPEVDFTQFYGVNTFFNAEFNEFASGTGGKLIVEADGAGMMGYTALSAPSWTWQAAVAHEMARGMGLTLTNNADDDDNSYDNPWTLMSDSRAYANIDPDFNYIAKHINAHDKELLGWLDDVSIYNLERTYLNNGTTLEIELDALGEESSGNQRAVKFIDVTGGENAVYYIEARFRDGIYDGSLPRSGVLVHELVPGRYEPAWLYFDPALGEPSDYSDTPADILTEGEQIVLDGVEVSVVGRTASGYTLRFHSDLNFIPAGSGPSSGDTGNNADGSDTGSGDNGGNTNSGDNNTGTNNNSGTLVQGGSSGSVSAGGGGGSGSISLLLLFLLLLLSAAKRRPMASRSALCQAFGLTIHARCSQS